MRPMTTTVTWLGMVVALSGCTGAQDQPEGHEEPEGEEVQLRAVTYNVGLARLDVDYATERAPKVVEALAGLDADVLCVQELWDEGDFELLRDAVEDDFPTAQRLAPMPVVASCSHEEIAPLSECVATACDGLSGEPLESCAFDRCGEELGELSDGCASCVVDAVMPDGDLPAIEAACAPITACTDEELIPLAECASAACGTYGGIALAACAMDACEAELAALSDACAACVSDTVEAGRGVSVIRTQCSAPGGSAGYLFGGAFDTALFTHLPVLASDSRVLDSYIVRASVEYALLEGPAGPGDEVHVFCTHLASAISTFTYEGEHGDWKGEQLFQIQQLLEMIDEKTAGGGRVLVMGDLNHGPAIPSAGIEAQWPEHYDTLMSGAGLDNPYARQDDVACTSCPDSSFHDPGSRAKLIDHVLSRGIEAETWGERLYDDIVEIEVGGVPVETHLSDHYALSMTFTY